MRKKDLKGDVTLFDYPSHVIYLHNENKGKMPYFGVYDFSGPQGSGKTLNAVRLVNNIFADYPNTLLVSNIYINLDICTNIPKENVIDFRRYYQLYEFEDEEMPVIFLIDEAHILFNSLNSRNTDVNLFKLISQNRKRRRIFILTSQVFSRLEKFMREQINTIITSKTYLNFLTIGQVYSNFDINKEELVGTREFSFMFTHKKDVHYKMYDTRQVIDYSADSPFWTSKKQDIKDGNYEYIHKCNLLHKEEHSSNNSLCNN